MNENRSIDPGYLKKLIEIFCWLDEEHQQKACNTIETILQDQIEETIAKKQKAI